MIRRVPWGVRQEEGEVALEELLTYLRTVDAHCTRSDEWLMPVLECFTKYDVWGPDDMIGLDLSKLADMPIGGKGAFMERAVVEATKRAKSHEAVARISSEPDRFSPVHVEAMMQALQQEDKKVHVNLRAKLPKMVLVDTITSRT